MIQTGKKPLWGSIRTSPFGWRVACEVWCFVLWGAAVASQAAALETGKEKLRQLVVFPTFKMEYGFHLSSSEGFTFINDPEQVPRTIAALRQELKVNPEDTGCLVRLADQLSKAGDEPGAEQACYRALTLLRARAEARPKDGLLQAELGKALSMDGKDPEAEIAFRAAVRLAPSAWRCWEALGSYLGDKAKNILMYGDQSPGTNPSLPNLWAAITSRQPTLDQLKQAEELEVEASGCLDRAVALAPKEPEAYCRRAIHRSGADCIKRLLRHFRGQEKLNPQTWGQAVCLPESLADIKQVARLSPTNYLAIAAAAFFEVMAPELGGGAKVRTGELPLDQLPEKTRQSVREALTRLEDLGQSPNRPLASGALESLGCLQFILVQEADLAKTTLRRALALDPQRHQTWDVLVGLSGATEKPAELVRICEERLQHRDSPRNRLLLAKAFDKAGQVDKAMSQTRLALQAAPEEPKAHLALAVLLLRRAKDKPALAEIEPVLAKAHELLRKSAKKEQNRDLFVELMLNSSIYAALTDHEDAAREWLARLLKDDPENEQAKEVLAVLGK